MKPRDLTEDQALSAAQYFMERIRAGDSDHKALWDTIARARRIKEQEQTGPEPVSER